MKTKIALVLGSLFVAASVSYAASCAACAGGAKAAKTSTPIGMDVVETAAGAGDFGTLVAAIEAAGLTGALQSADNITVFAPNDAAFAALPDGVVETLLLPENKDTLVAILTYHVIPVEVFAANVTPGSVNTLEGSPIEIAITDGTVTVNDATVIATDVEASNGVIHVIDQVILPPSVEL
ncbi:MAG: fasciclin domain-containing protein [Verrucomicrobiota bacterium]